MKFNKLFFAALSFAALAMVGCNKKGGNSPVVPPTPQVDPGEEAPELISLAAPGAGKSTIAIYADVCPAGAYLVGTANSWNEKSTELKFEAVPNQENWYALTVEFDGAFEGKVLAIPSDPDVALGWSYQWGKNYDPEDPGDVPEGTANTVKLGGKGEFKYENQGQPKLIEIADNGVVYIWVKNWATSPVIEAKKLETCWIKTDWDGGDDNTGWEYREMEAKGNGVFEKVEVWGGKGCNVAADGNGAGEQWYPTDQIEFVGDKAKAGDKVRFTFTSEKMAIGKLQIAIVEPGDRPQYEVKDVTISGIVPDGWTKCYIWAWGGENDENYTGGVWPGEELTIDGGKVTKAFSQVTVPMNVIFSNGEGTQTKDITGITENVEINIAENLQ